MVVGKEWPGSLEFSVGQAENGLVGDGSCLHSIFACGFAIPLAG